MSGTCGPTSRLPFASFDPQTSCWRTSQGTFDGGSEPFSGTWPRSGMTQGGSAYELPMPVLRTPEPACSSLLPTPAVNDMGEGKTVEAWDEWTAKMRAKHANGNGHGPSLAIEVQRLLGTPRAADGMNQPMRSTVKNARSRLKDQVALLSGASTPQPSTDGQQSWDDLLPQWSQTDG